MFSMYYRDYLCVVLHGLFHYVLLLAKPHVFIFWVWYMFPQESAICWTVPCLLA